MFDPGLSGVIEVRSCREVADQELANNEGLGRDRTPLLNQLGSLKLPLLRRQNQAHLKLAERQRLEIDREIQSRIRENRVLVLSVAILCSIPGIGTVGAAALLIELAGIGTLNHQLVANLAGLAPITRQLGNWRGQAFILDGRNHLHDALYMAALGATRANPDLNAISIRLHEQLEAHLDLFIDACSHARRLKTFKGLTPAQFIWKELQSRPELFHKEPFHLIAGLNT